MRVYWPQGIFSETSRSSNANRHSDRRDVLKSASTQIAPSSASCHELNHTYRVQRHVLSSSLRCAESMASTFESAWTTPSESRSSCIHSASSIACTSSCKQSVRLAECGLIGYNFSPIVCSYSRNLTIPEPRSPSIAPQCPRRVRRWSLGTRQACPQWDCSAFVPDCCGAERMIHRSRGCTCRHRVHRASHLSLCHSSSMPCTLMPLLIICFARQTAHE